MTKNEYNGWTNYETWNCKLWFDNDAGTQEMLSEWAKNAVERADDKDGAVAMLEESIREHVSENNPVGHQASMYADIMGAALREINFAEIALSIINDMDSDVLSKFDVQVE